MIDISQDGTNVSVSLKGAYPIGGKVFKFSWNAGTDWAANLLWAHFFDLMGKELRRIREESYQQGWKDAKSHRTKETWFAPSWK